MAPGDFRKARGILPFDPNAEDPADQLAELEAEYDHHVWAMRFHTHEARRLLPMLQMLRAAVAREEANLDKQAKRWMGPETRRSA